MRFYWVFATLCMIIAFLFHYPKNIKLTLFGITLCGIIACFVYLKISEYRNKHQVWLDPRDYSVFVQIESIFIWSRNESNGERINRWQAAKLMFGESKWTGIGIQRYFFYRDKIERSKIAETNRMNDYMNAHNIHWHYSGTGHDGYNCFVRIYIKLCISFTQVGILGILGILIFLHYLLLY
ncbi:MAG: O-antigen ligase family protein [Bacteroidia bacterium]|nr:O-antigen ligase family protein [Bacteroidia bacterium]